MIRQRPPTLRMASSPNDLSVSMEGDNSMDSAKTIFRTYWQGVCDELEQRLANDGHDERWEVVFFPDIDSIFENWAGLSITWRHRPPSCQPRDQLRGCFSFFVENIARRNNNTACGVLRGINDIRYRELSTLDRRLRHKLRHEGFNGPIRVADFWVGYRQMAVMDPALPIFDVENRDAVNKLCAEVGNPERPLTQRVVGLIWKLFCDFRCDLERLNCNYPYP